MCLLIVEVLFFVAGLYMLFTGSVPQDMMGILFGRKRTYAFEPMQSRMLGAMLAAPLTFGLVFGFIMGFVAGMMGDDSFIVMAQCGESILLILVAIVAIVYVRQNSHKDIS
ncbi:MAG TPA: hypothetical protein VLL52_19140 [Anaerolineae bacterium]|nr:hypothetical protein [Anaerolineae bacterium]